MRGKKKSQKRPHGFLRAVKIYGVSAIWLPQQLWCWRRQCDARKTLNSIRWGRGGGLPGCSATYTQGCHKVDDQLELQLAGWSLHSSRWFQIQIIQTVIHIMNSNHHEEVIFNHLKCHQSFPQKKKCPIYFFQCTVQRSETWETVIDMLLKQQTRPIQVARLIFETLVIVASVWQ